MSDAQIIPAILDSGFQAVIAVTGGGSGAISALLQTPGASRTVLEAVVPYAGTALEDWLGGAPEQFCSASTARAMAMASFRRAKALAPHLDPLRLVGVGCTASLVSDRPKRGDHRFFVAAQTARLTMTLAVTLEKGLRDRAGEEAVATESLLRCLAAATCAGASLDEIEKSGLGPSEHVEVDRQDATPALTELVLGARLRVNLRPGAVGGLSSIESESPRPVVFPGAFNPIHAGHLGMAAVAERRLGQSVAWELSIANVDKPPLDFISIRDRVGGLRKQGGDRSIALTYAPTFREKAALFPGCVFVVGADTLTRIAEPRYYGGDATQRDEAIRVIAQHGCRFLAFGRQVGGEFQTLDDMQLSPALHGLCEQVPADEFREDVSSTDIRSSGDETSAY